MRGHQPAAQGRERESLEHAAGDPEEGARQARPVRSHPVGGAVGPPHEPHLRLSADGPEIQLSVFRVPLGVDGVQAHLHPDVGEGVPVAVDEAPRGARHQLPHGAPDDRMDQGVGQDVGDPPPGEGTLQRGAGRGEEPAGEGAGAEGVGEIRKGAETARHEPHVRSHGADEERVDEDVGEGVEGRVPGSGAPAIQSSLGETEMDRYAGHARPP